MRKHQYDEKDCCPIGKDLKVKARDLIHTRAYTYKHTHTTHTGQLRETGVEVSPGSRTQIIAYGWAPDVCLKLFAA